MQNPNNPTTTLSKISLPVMLLLGAGWFGSNFFWGFYSGSMPLFLKNFTQSKFLISLVLGSAGLASCIVPPVVGYLSDHSLGRFGRRKPFVVAGVGGVLLCLSFLPHLKMYGTVAALSVVLYFSIAIAETPLFSLLPDLTPPEQRSTVSGVVHLMGSFGLIIFFILSSMIWDNHPVAVFRMAALVTFAAMMTVVLLIREPALRERPKRTLNPMAYLKSIVRETQAMKYFAAQFFIWQGFYMIASFMPLFLVEELGVSEGDSFYVPTALTIVSTLAMVPLGLLGDRMGRKKLLSIMIALWGIMGLFIALCRNLPEAVIAVGLTGIPFATILGVGYAYLLDLIPRERTAEFVGFSIFSISLPMVIGTVMSGTMIDVFGYRFLFPIASLMMFIGLIILQFTRPRHDNGGSE